jgi:hypothetical protein
MSVIQVEHNGFQISYNEYSNKWHIEDMPFRVKSDYESMTKAKEALDRRIKESSKIEPFIAFISDSENTSYGRSNIYHRVKVTSINEKDEAWCGSIDGKQERFKYTGTLYLDTPENEKSIIEIHALNNEIKRLERNRSDLNRSLAQIDLSVVRAKQNKEEA